jgi:predicted house-cleaning noncanonical NTP pyrophosphatase (MazG superfamily)
VTRAYDKLVRDRIPEVIRDNGETPHTHTESGEDYERRLADKLVEEATEYRESGALEELADVLAVLDALCAYRGLSRERLDEKRAEKAADRGGFTDGIVLDHVEE